METILVVEDDYLSRDALSRRLERSGYHVMRAVDGEQAIAMVQVAPPDLILMDLGLPVLDGWQATKRLKADSATRDIPIIIVSAHVQASDRAMVIAAGGDDLDSKPVNFDGLLIKIGTLLKRAH
jgi:CheY-like chemotaxis protein